MEWSGAERSRAERSGAEWSGVEWRGVAWHGVAWRGVIECTLCLLYGRRPVSLQDGRANRQAHRRRLWRWGGPGTQSNSAPQVGFAWGFDYNFTNYNFKQKP